jgi:AcrR family transcriptional regulator
LADQERQKLLEAAMEYVAANGLTDLSMRALAAEIGTSHRMLSHHFGSKAGLWVAIVREVERRQREIVAALEIDPEASEADRLRTIWRHFSDPSLAPNERLFFEVYGQALQGQPHTAELLEGIVDDWVEPAAEAAAAAGKPIEQARAEARLGVAITRGLLLDLLATGDRAAVDAALEHWIELREAAAGGA